MSDGEFGRFAVRFTTTSNSGWLNSETGRTKNG